MTGITFTVEIADDEAAARLAGMVDRMTRPIGFYKGVGEYLTEVAIPRNFKAEASPDGTPWARLRSATIKRREKRGQTPLTILRSNSGTSQNLSASIISQSSETGVEVGSPLPYAAIHQFGAAQGQFGAFMGKDKLGRDHFHHLPWGDIPARPYLGLSGEDEAEIIRIAEDWIEAEQ
ncbi:phage virion morphogenesis protein [Tabrizicola fusiformis]|uniref:phage virion morphogenesis protein n=1 Tax=Tabrizicola sp. SY72 TaxID=2741673 RepID=UPI0015730D68|nr:phage virion morphogenesis protein [Tabrizicola sp. SY72]NTT88258.1 phage virion morphogenesis protein [Tabrizicola sp. SY72]